MASARERLAQLASITTSLMVAWAMFQRSFLHGLPSFILDYPQILPSFIYPYIEIRFNEFSAEHLVLRSEAYSAIDNYLSSIKSFMHTKRLKADIVQNSQSLSLSMDDGEEIADEFEGFKIWWASGKIRNPSPPISLSFRPTSEDKRYYKLTFHKRHRDLVLGPYLNGVLKEGKAIKLRNRSRKLYTNAGPYWSPVVFEHPATFQTIAMNPKKKKEIIDDLIAFSKAEDFYASVGRAWKRGYLLYGPPGTGKSTMIAAMANLLGYDIYDLELTAVKDNTELRNLLIEISSKSIIVIEDIDCSLDLTGQRRKKNEKVEAGKDSISRQKLAKDEMDTRASSQVTLSGLLNFIDGIWSACGGERLIVFTTNYVENLDPALIRKGRMDVHVELPYCRFDAFKVLAKNYLNLESHTLFPKISVLLEETNMTPADVADHLMANAVLGDATFSLQSLIHALETAKEEARLRGAEGDQARKIQQLVEE
ncbi:hypothetical protein I3842_16G075400 [Carya illinoinensis]|uniref:AAA+ ATPase domain-containing protein n=1 Tax=Carya illinoinensis TaxID=32201 RepID=A0A922A0N3_CARIL|nr:hypothetical protein I3842_16G075400 [Carya illinoinensis]